MEQHCNLKMSTTKVEFAVQMTCDSCVKQVKQSLENVEGIKSVDVDLETNSVVVNSNLAITEVQKLLESTGKKVVVKGQAGSLAAVSVLEVGDKNVKGVVRFMQPIPDVCIIDGTIDNLNVGAHQISIHECGDLSEGCKNVGEIFNPKGTGNGRVYGDLGIVAASKDGRAAFRLEDNVVKVSEIIGRSFVVTDKTGGSETGKMLSAGVIARSAGLFQNPKTICACDGVTIWDEASKTKSSL